MQQLWDVVEAALIQRYRATAQLALRKKLNLQLQPQDRKMILQVVR